MIELRSTITCPRCSHAENLAMPVDACVVRHECSACGALLASKPGDCCVFCSYGTVPCPPIQQARRGEAPGGCC